MTRIEKIKRAIEIGYSCNFETGEVFNSLGNLCKSKINGYIKISINEKGTKITKVLRAHHFIYFMYYKELSDNLHIDHINRIRTDNRICNLRLVTQHQNNINTNRKGYCYDKCNKNWYMRLTLNGKMMTQGRFKTEEEAKIAYLEAKKIYHII